LKHFLHEACAVSTDQLLVVSRKWRICKTVTSVKRGKNSFSGNTGVALRFPVDGSSCSHYRAGPQVAIAQAPQEALEDG